MTRFEQELSGALGAFWKKHAEEEIAKMQERIDNDEIRTNIGGGAFWNSNGNYLPEECAEILSHTDFPFSIEETRRARKPRPPPSSKTTRRTTKDRAKRKRQRCGRPSEPEPRWSTSSRGRGRGFKPPA